MTNKDFSGIMVYDTPRSSGCGNFGGGQSSMKSWTSHYTIDPAELEARFSTEDSMAYMESIFDEPSDEDLEKIETIRNIIDQLPPKEADFIDLYYFKKLKQTNIASIFGVSQPTVCYRLSRAADRIRFLLHLPEISIEQMESDLAGFLQETLDVQIMVLMYKTTCQSEVAERLGVSQGLVRHRFFRTIRKMSHIPRFEQYVKLFNYIADNLNILREVQHPSWDGKVFYCIR